MSHANKPQVGPSFEIVRNYFKSVVPPCVAEVDTPTHYEAVAVGGDTKRLFGNVVAHDHVVSVGFYDQIPENDFRQLVSEHLIKHMTHHRLEIRDADVHAFTKDLQDAIQKLARYYNEKGWTK